MDELGRSNDIFGDKFEDIDMGDMAFVVPKSKNQTTSLLPTKANQQKKEVEMISSMSQNEKIDDTQKLREFMSLLKRQGLTLKTVLDTLEFDVQGNVQINLFFSKIKQITSLKHEDVQVISTVFNQRGRTSISSRDLFNVIDQ
jgi:hypothetical protein